MEIAGSFFKNSSRIAFFTLRRLVAEGSLFFPSVSGVKLVQTSFAPLSCEE